VRFRVLGPLEVDDGGAPITIAAPKQRALLTLLLVHHDERVSVDRIADALWGEAPPATAVKTVQVYIGQLRKALGETALVTSAGAYTAVLDGHDLDLVTFERLLAEGTRLLEDGDPRGARAALADALALWRGPTLEDLPDGEDARRLADQRLLALERRIDADLALGRHEAVVAELRALVARHPLDEGLRERLMLALYRSGRQAEALEAHREGRALLVGELGLEPGPRLQALERAILAQDPAIDAPGPAGAGAAAPAAAGPSGEPVAVVAAPISAASAAAGPDADPAPAADNAQPRPRRRRRTIAVAAAALALAAAALAVVLVTRDDRGAPTRPALPPDAVAAIDARSGKVVDSAATGTGPATVAVGGGAVWALNADDRTLTRVDLATHERRTLGLGATPTDIAFGLGSLWVGTGATVRGAQFAGLAATDVVRLDPHTGIATDPIPLPPARGAVSNAVSGHLAFAGGSAWMVDPDFSVSRIDPERNAVAAALTRVRAVAIASDGRRLWALSPDRTLSRINPRTERVVQRVRVPATGLNAIAVGEGAVWALDPDAGRLWRVEPSGQVSIDVGAGADAVAVGAGAVWVTNSLLGQVLRVDPATDRVARRIALGGTPRDLDVAGSRVWVAVSGAGRSAARPARSGEVRAIDSRACGPPVAGAAPARLLVASDLPLQGGARFPTRQMAAAVISVLRAHGFRAGRFPLAYQSCDDSVARSGLYDPVKCAANARAYAAAPQLVGVVGPLNSGCAFAQVPIVSAASLALISPTATDPGLTRPPPGAARRAERQLHPRGIRTFARLVAPDDAEAAADAMLVVRGGATRPFVLHDNGFYAAFGPAAARALRRLGTRPAGVAHWNIARPRPAALARQVRAAGADGLVLCGVQDTGAGAMLRAARAALPPGAPVVACDGLLPASVTFAQAGSAAAGVLVTRPGLSADRLPPAGRALARRLGRDTDVTAVYAAAATEALLAAIAASDGTRASVNARLRATRYAQSPIGPYALDRVGDPRPAPVSVFRLERPGGSNAILSEEGARTLAPVVPPPRLWTSVP
jgi:DNA-binding SARP family transcriptional activator/ABC-type branched-subunit amino acid transport system substrate-binding protein/DNA-binding beta-propeller fold protein YncE